MVVRAGWRNAALPLVDRVASLIRSVWPFFGSETFLLLPALCFLFVVDVDVVDVVVDVVDVAAQANFGYLFR